MVLFEKNHLNDKQYLSNIIYYFVYSIINNRVNKKYLGIINSNKGYK